MTQLAWPAVALAALFLFWLPVLVAAIRGAERIGMVVLATLLTILLPPAWFAALALAFRLPGKKAVCRRGTSPRRAGLSDCRERKRSPGGGPSRRTWGARRTGRAPCRPPAHPWCAGQLARRQVRGPPPGL